MANYKFKINGNDYSVDINSIEGNVANVNVNGTDYKVEMADVPASAAPVIATPTEIPASKTQSQQQPDDKPVQKPAGAGRQITSPLPGVIIEVSVKEGQTVKAGQKVAIIEAMKMENEISASNDGTVTAVHVAKGDSVLEGAPIVTIA
ncbi:MAG: biotin/lipoyl-containing protein [Candidatus Cryptobacteroides sp.]|jgi:Acetyl/propionyl-CoA carboxylase, alpha subunit